MAGMTMAGVVLGRTGKMQMMYGMTVNDMAINNEVVFVPGACVSWMEKSGMFVFWY